MKKYPLLEERLNREHQASWSIQELDLKDVEELHARLGFPGYSFQTIHITGTKGKGSTAEMFSATLQEAGMSVGVYASPHIVSLEERIRLNGNFIPENRLNEILEQKLRPVVQELESEGRSFSFFEILTIAAFEYFAEEKADIVVVETGLGGAHDATNICRPVLTVVTNIALDHTRQLGETLEDIAREKAGIIKEGVRLIVGEMPTDVRERVFPIISQIAKERSAPTSWAGLHFPSQPLPDVTLGMAGAHQRANAAIVCQAARLFSDNISLQALWNGLKKATLPGRLETVSQNPLTILDAAHNLEAVTKISDWIRETYPENPKTFVFAAAKDKNWQKMLLELLRLEPETLILTSFSQERATDPAEMEAWLRQVFPGSFTEISTSNPTPTQNPTVTSSLTSSSTSILRLANPREAVSLAQKSVQEKACRQEKAPMILITGSFFLLREIYGLFRK